MKTKIDEIVIVGGGTAGWATATMLLDRTDAKITVVASKEIPIIGVGESTTARFHGLLNLKNGRVEKDHCSFLNETGATYKFGIKHTDWRVKGEHFYSPLGDTYQNHTTYPTPEYDNLRVYATSKGLTQSEFYNNYLLEQNKVYCVDIDDDKYKNIFGDNKKVQLNVPKAYHLDTYKTGQYLKNRCLRSNGCDYVDDEVVDCEKDENGYIKYLKTKSGKQVSGDLFIDCTGFKRLLISKFYENEFISYKDNLLVNSAIPFHIKNKEDEPIRNYTHAWAQKHGWLWEIPLQERKGCGYVYSDNHTTDDEALKEIAQVYGHKVEPNKTIKFETGRLKQPWIKNVLSTGLATAFIEPLEATSIHCTVTQISEFIENYYTKTMNFANQSLIDMYNDNIGNMWDDYRDFLIMHYQSKRKDTQFWIDSSNTERHTKWLSSRLEIWKDRMPRIFDYQAPLKGRGFYDFGLTLYLQILMGMKIFKKEMAENELREFGIYETTKDWYDKFKDYSQYCAKRSLTTNEYYKDPNKYESEYKII